MATGPSYFVNGVWLVGSVRLMTEPDWPQAIRPHMAPTLAVISEI